MTHGFRFRAHPDDKVAGVLARWIGCQRYLYNAKVREDCYYRAFQRRFVDFAGQYAPVDQMYSHLIGDGGACAESGIRHEADSTWLREVPSQVLRNGAARFFGGYKRFFKGLARRPTIQKRHGEQSVWLTSELFSFKPVVDADGVVTGYRLLIGTNKFPCGELPVICHRPGWTPPASIHVSVNAGRWHVSFSNEPAEGVLVPTEAETLEQLRSMPMGRLVDLTLGVDRGVATPLMASGVREASGAAQAFDLLPVQRTRLAKKDLQRKRWQRRAARRVKGSANRRKANQRAARVGIYAADVRTDFAHQVSRVLVNGPHQLFVFEALKVKNMTKSAAGTIAKPGKKVAQKRGLNRSILASAWGETKQFTKYKAIAAGKLCIEVPPHYSSQECSACGHTHAGNRLDQSHFFCQRCGHTENADVNAGRVVAWRGAWDVVSGSYVLKAKKKVGGLRREPSTKADEVVNGEIQPGQELPEVTSVETVVRRRRPRPAAHVSSKQKFLGVSQDAPTRGPQGI